MGCAEKEGWSRQKVFKEMKVKGLALDEITHNAFVNGYCKEGNFQQILALHVAMVRNGLSWNVVTYTSLITLYQQKISIDKCIIRNFIIVELAMCRKMLHCGLVPHGNKLDQRNNQW